MAAALQLTFAALCWSNNIPAQRQLPTTKPRGHLYVTQRDIPNWIW